MSNDEKKTYIVKRPITFMGSVFEAGSEINLTDADAHNIGMGDFLDEKKSEGEETTTPPTGEGEQTQTPPSGEGSEAGEGQEGSGSQTDKPAGEGSEGSQDSGSAAGENSQA